MKRMTAVMLAVAVSAALTARAERTFAVREWINRDWPRTLLNYDIEAAPGEFVAGKTELVDGEGQAVQHQVTVVEAHDDGSIAKARVSFYAALAKGSEGAYTLRSAESPTEFPDRVTAHEDVRPPSENVEGERPREPHLVVESAEAGVSVPAPCVTVFDPPVAASEVPAPILGFRLADGRWAGKGWIETDSKVTRFSQTVVADGPLYKEYAYRLEFAPSHLQPSHLQPYYAVRVRVEAELPMVYVSEEYDLCEMNAARDFFVLSLSEGWTPDTTLYSACRSAGENLVHVRPSRLEHDSHVWSEPIDFSADRRHKQFFPHNDWGNRSQWYMLSEGQRNSEPRTQNPEVDAAGDISSLTTDHCPLTTDSGNGKAIAGIMSMHTGSWCFPDQSLSEFRWTADGEVLAKMRLSLEFNGVPSNPFSTGEPNPALPVTLGRRMWALVTEHVETDNYPSLPPAVVDRLHDVYRSYYGYITLDDYKDWILEWDEDESLSRPRAIMTKAQWERLRANLDRWPGMDDRRYNDELRNSWLISLDPEKAEAEAQYAARCVSERLWLLAYFMGHYRQTECDYDYIFHADSALACPSLDPETRRTLRARIAAMCYVMTNPDFNPRGTSMHLGNPNMPINRYMGIPPNAVAIQDHPMAKAWLDEANVYVRWKISHNVASGGGTWRENPGYATHGPAIFINTAAIALKNAGYDIDRFEPLKA
ncbi:MAG: hypothetical protein FWF84_05740, partial [Kiritimatiellaeota bacterium]|nr:hypothetical protein [Kiritimatiellota bacterium]